MSLLEAVLGDQDKELGNLLRDQLTHPPVGDSYLYPPSSASGSALLSCSCRWQWLAAPCLNLWCIPPGGAGVRNSGRD